MEPKKAQQWKPPNYHKNNPELFTKIIKNLEELKNNEKIKVLLDTTKVSENQR